MDHSDQKEEDHEHSKVDLNQQVYVKPFLEVANGIVVNDQPISVCSAVPSIVVATSLAIIEHAQHNQIGEQRAEKHVRTAEHNRIRPHRQWIVWRMTWEAIDSKTLTNEGVQVEGKTKMEGG